MCGAPSKRHVASGVPVFTLLLMKAISKAATLLGNCLSLTTKKNIHNDKCTALGRGSDAEMRLSVFLKKKKLRYRECGKY